MNSLRSRPKSAFAKHRDNNSDAVLVLVHGFCGDVEKTWGMFPSLICANKSVEGWDVFSLGYTSSLRVDVPGLWSADPDIRTLAKALRTSLSIPPFARYQAIAVAAHSMGGLVVQRAILDDAKLEARLAFAFFFGTPSNGLRKAGLVGRLKRQLRDMATESPFISGLRDEWRRHFAESYPFEVRVVAGDTDEFVPSSSSLEPFPDSVQYMVPGNHLEIVKPSSGVDASVRLVVDALAGNRHTRGVVDGARLAVEQRQFQQAVDVLLPRAAALDDAAMVSLALALDGLGRGEDALRILEEGTKRDRTSIDALGVLGGRYKRRWLSGRADVDLVRARELYLRGLELAEIEVNHEEAYYHAINVAFLDLMSSIPESAVPPEVLEMVRRALFHCGSAAETPWQIATTAEAELMLGHLDRATDLYSRAISRTESPRNIDSMYSQAIRVANRTHGRAGIERIERVFGMPTRQS